MLTITKKDFYEKYPDLKQFDNFIKTYSYRDIDGNLICKYEREDVNDDWKDVTEEAKLEEKIIKLQAEQRKLELKARLSEKKDGKNDFNI